MDHKNVIKHEIRGPPPIFSHNPKYPPQNNLKMTVHLCSMDHSLTYNGANALYFLESFQCNNNKLVLIVLEK
jgi:hypothetical protein